MTPCYTSNNFTMDGGYLGFARTGCDIFIDNLTIYRWTGAAWAETMEDHFDLNSGYSEDRPEHDAAGNMIYDGLHKLSYDAWNKLCQVERAWRGPSDNALHSGGVIATLTYDALGRRVEKKVENSGDWNATYRYYYDSDQLVEERDGAGKTIRQYVWGTQYVDDLAQIAINPAPSDCSTCSTKYWALQDANYNVLGIVEDCGTLKERYEYTPYGQRTVYKSAGSADTTCRSPILDTQPVTVSGVAQAYGICDVGHQGTFFEKEFRKNFVRTRYWDPVLMRWISPDPSRYIDGNSYFEGLRSNPLCGLDPSGTKTIADYMRDLIRTEDQRAAVLGLEGLGDGDEILNGFIKRTLNVTEGTPAKIADSLKPLGREQDAIKGKMQAIMNRAAFLGVDPLGLDDESEEWNDSTWPYRLYFGQGVGQGVGNGVADTAYQLVTLGFAKGNWIPFGGKDNPGQAWGYATGRIAGEIVTVAIPAKYLGYSGKSAKLVNLMVKGLTTADKIQNVVILGKTGERVVEELIEGKASSDTVLSVVLIGATLYVMPKALFAQDAPDVTRTAQDIIVAKKKGSIYREFPTEMLGKTPLDIERLAKTGDAAARKAKKLLTDGRFNK